MMVLAGMVSAYTVREFKVSPAEKLFVPATPDSTQSENPFKPEKLLDVRNLPIDDAAAAGWTTMVPDTAGRLRLATTADIPYLRSLTTRIRPERYVKGRLVLNSTSRAQVKVNGVKTITKTTADSLPTDAEAPLTMNPEADYNIHVDLLTMPDDKSAPDFKLEFIPDEPYKNVVISSGASLKGRVSPLSTMVGERTSSMSLSPDGKYLITRFRDVQSASDTRRRAQLSETATGRVLSDDLNSDCFWMPEGATLAYAVKKGETYTIYRMDVPSMQTSLMAKEIPTSQLYFSPDGNYMFYMDDMEAEKEEGPMHRLRTPDDRIPGDRDRSYIVRYDLRSHIALPLTYGGATTSISDISQDGKQLLYASAEQTPDRYPFYKMSLMQMDMATLSTDTILRMDGTISQAIYSPDAKKLFIVAGPDAFGSIGANYAPEPIGNDFDGQGYIYDLATHQARAVTRDFNPAVEPGAVWNASNGIIYFPGEKGFYKRLFSLDPATGKITELPSDLDYVRGFSIGDNESQWLAYYGGGFTTDGEAYLLNLKSGKSRLVADPLAETLKDVEFGKMEPWKFTSKDGDEIDGFMCLPPDFDASKKYPLIVYYYGGTSPSNATFYHLYSPQVFASRDYVVYVVNPSGTTGYGQEFSARHVNAWGKRTADEIIEGVKKFCAAHPYVDSKKIGCIGASYGGFMTQYLQTQTDIFAAAVSHAGISNVTSYWGEGFWGYSYNSVAAAKSYPWTDPDLFTKQGSLFNADKIHTPLLLLHGTVDTNVPIGESIQLYNALKILGRDVEFITVQDENHVISGFDNKLAWQNTIMAWFAKYLQDDPSWWNALYK